MPQGEKVGDSDPQVMDNDVDNKVNALCLVVHPALMFLNIVFKLDVLLCICSKIKFP